MHVILFATKAHTHFRQGLRTTYCGSPARHVYYFEITKFLCGHGAQNHYCKITERMLKSHWQITY